jgi:hypothetical protein
MSGVASFPDYRRSRGWRPGPVRASGDEFFRFFKLSLVAQRTNDVRLLLE